MLTEAKKPSFSRDRKSYGILKDVYSLQEDSWGIFASRIKEYSEFFGEDIVAFAQTRPSLVAIDLMASAHTLFDLFSKVDSPSKMGIAVSLSDLRGDEKIIHRGLGITQIAGDLTETGTWRKLKSTLGDKKADLIMERGEGAWDFFPDNERFFAIMLSQLWEMLSHNNGKMLLEIPRLALLDKYGVRYGEWFDNLVNSGISPEEISLTDRRLKLTKTLQSPKRLPFLPTSK